MNSETLSPEEVLAEQLRTAATYQIIWTRLLIFSVINDSGDAQFLNEQLLRNIQDYVDILEPVVGEEAANILQQSLTELNRLLNEMLISIRNRDYNAIGQAKREWLMSARQLSKYIASINANWSADKWYSLLSDYINTAEKLATYRINSQYQAVVEEVVNSEKVANAVVEYLIEGLIAKRIQSAQQIWGDIY